MSAKKKTSASSSRQPTLALCVIARDEEANIASCIESAREFVDEVVVVDTGSVDRTREVAAERGARVSEFVWCDDFSAARNAAIDAATADWILMLDADEVLRADSGSRLKPLIARAPKSVHVYLPRIDSVIDPTQADGYIISRHSRLFRRSAELRFVGPIHEAIRYLPAPLTTVREDADEIRIEHMGYVPAYYNARGKDERNMRLLTRWRDADESDALVHFHIGVQHAAMNRHEQTVVAMQRAIELSGRERPWFLVDAYMRLVNALLQSNRIKDLDAVVAIADDANMLSPKVREVLAGWYRKRGMLPEAEQQLKKALDPTCIASLTNHPGAGGWAARLALADLYETLGRPREALAELELALAAPDLLPRARASRSAARVCFSLGDTAATRRWLAEAKRHTRADFDDQIELLQLRLDLAASAAGRAQLNDLTNLEDAISRGDWQLAYDTALQAPLGDPLAYTALLHLADRLHREGAPDAALDVLNRVLSDRPEWPRVYWLLMRILAAVARYDDALAAAEILRDLENSRQAGVAA